MKLFADNSHAKKYPSSQIFNKIESNLEFFFRKFKLKK